MPSNKFALEKIRTGDPEPYEVIEGAIGGPRTVTNYDAGTVTTIQPDGTETVEVLNAGN